MSSFRRILPMLAFIMLASTPFPALAADIEVKNAWSRATPGAASIGALYLDIVNSGPSADRLLTIETPVAARNVVHRSEMDGGVMRMRPVADGLEVAPGATLQLKPGGLHGMLMGLKKPLKEGESFAATLVFEKAGRIDVDVNIMPIGAQSAGQTGHAGHDSHHKQ